jgi:predicted TIM-barrel fold metal-dependent hydrolase
MHPSTQPPPTQPPDPHPRKPKLLAPPGSIDCAIHLFGPASEFPFHPDSRYSAADALPETHIALQDTLGLAGAVVVSGGGYGPDTRHLIHVLERFPDRFRGVALLPEDVTMEHIERLDRLGVRGARFISTGHRGALPRLSPRIAAMVHEFGWHIQFYPHGTDLLEHADALLALPNRIVLDHFAHIPAAGGTGQPAFKKLLEILDTGRVWTKISGPMRCTEEDYPYASVTPMARALVAHAPQRLLWGTDWPHPNMNGRLMPNDGDLFDLLSECVDDRAVLEQILVKNPREVYGEFGKPAK